MNDKTAAAVAISEHERNRDSANARRFADQVSSMLRDFIPTHCRQDAWHLLNKAAADGGLELISRDTRKQYEALSPRAVQHAEEYVSKGIYGHTIHDLLDPGHAWTYKPW